MWKAAKDLTINYPSGDKHPDDPAYRIEFDMKKSTFIVKITLPGKPHVYAETIDLLIDWLTGFREFALQEDAKRKAKKYARN